MTSTVDYAAHGFKNPFGVTVREVEISVWLIVTDSRHNPHPVGVYIFHGTPAGEFWRNEPPLVRCTDITEGRAVAERIYGITGSGQFAEVRRG